MSEQITPLWRRKDLIVYGVLVLLLALVSVLLLKQPKGQPVDQFNLAVNKPIVSNIVIEGLYGDEFVYLLLRDSRFTLDKWGYLWLAGAEELTSSGFMHPRNNNIVFFSTSSGTAEKNYQDNINRVYAYNLATGNLRLIYQDTSLPYLMTIGIAGSKLILFPQGFDDSPGPCWSKWTGVYGKSLQYLELAELDRGLRSYNVPRYKSEVETKKQKKCALGPSA